MSAPTDNDASQSDPRPGVVSPTRSQVTRIAVGVDGHAEGRDAAALGRAIADAVGAELMLVAVHPDPMLPLPSEMGWKSLRREAEKLLRTVRDAHAPQARIVAETDFSIPRALHRVVRAHDRDLLVVGSSRDAADGHVRIGKRTRQLLCHFECALAIAPRGLAQAGPVQLRSVGVGYDGGAESEAALALAATLAGAARAELQVQGVVDDRIPMLLRSPLEGLVAAEWSGVITEEKRVLREQALAALARLGIDVPVEVTSGRPADTLLALSEKVDLLVIGSRRWGPVSRVLLGSTGEAVLHDAACSVLTVPRPAAA